MSDDLERPRNRNQGSPEEEHQGYRECEASPLLGRPEPLLLLMQRTVNEISPT